MSQSVAIIGAGLAGAAVSDALRSQGMDVAVYEKGESPASGASGNMIGMFNPRLTAKPTVESAFYTQAFHDLCTMMSTVQTKSDIGFDRCGSVHLITNDKKRQKFEGIIETAGWSQDDLFLASAKEASDLSGMSLSHDAMVMPGAGCVSPEKLVKAWLEDVPVYNGYKATAIQQEQGKWRIFFENGRDALVDSVVIANSMDALSLQPDMPLRPVRGQVSLVQLPEDNTPTMNICYGGYLTAAHQGGLHALGATFDRGDTDTAFRPADQNRNREALAKVLPDLNVKNVSGRASVRCTTPDHFPICGVMPDRSGLYVSLAHGSHGILSSFLCGKILCSLIKKEPLDVFFSRLLPRLSPARFKK